jgi:hypothetical protein
VRGESAGAVSPSKPSARRHALGGIALATLFVVAQASTFVHQLEVQHAICAEHGEIVHVEGGGSNAAVEVGLDREVRSAPSVSQDHGHDHCLVTLPRREDFLDQVPADGLIVRRAEPQPVVVDRAVVALTGIELLLLAPKSSPPA